MNKSLSDDPNDVVLLTQRAQTYIQRGMWTEAAADLRTAVDMTPTSQIQQQHAFPLALILAYQNKIEEYNEICRRRLRVSDRAQYAHTALGDAKMCLVADSVPEPDIIEQAGKLADLATAAAIEEAIAGNRATESWRPFALHTKGLADYRRGNYDSAIRWFQESAKDFADR